MLTLTHATRADLADAVALLAAQLDEHAIPVARDDLERAVAGLIDVPTRGAVLLAREDGQAVGVAALTFTWSLEHAGSVAWLEELYVSPVRRSGGIGRALLQRAIDLAVESGCRAVDLEVTSEHARAAHLYARAGFEPLRRSRWALRLPASDA